ncbi:MAG: CRISPR-associated protein Cas4 [Gammaproteobacteria bacterium]|nr:CRISPR-associated protein Cas4 [Gammaproteobacteria bacterium]MBQ0839967.1 CRISPR-associated protein Cas4 [Gammaproteobacteria bacterium]
MTALADELLPIMISALQHYSYCPRQCALIHQEQTFTENVYTLRGQRVHKRVDEPGTSIEDGIQIERALPLQHKGLGLIGKADVVEVLADGSYCPVEYKHGPKRKKQHDDIQVAAQAMCLEEMTGKPVPMGVIYHYSSRRRREVPIDAALRQRVKETVLAVRQLLTSDKLPPPVTDPKLCKACSLYEVCQPVLLSSHGRLEKLAKNLFHPEREQER